MKTLEDALSVAGIIPHGVFEGEIGDIFFLAENEAGPCDGTRYGIVLEAALTPSELRLIADHLDPQPDSSPVIPEGWVLVPRTVLAPMISDAISTSSRVSRYKEKADSFAQELRGYLSGSGSPLRTEAAVRAGARREALEEAAQKVKQEAHYLICENGKPDPLYCGLQNCPCGVRKDLAGDIEAAIRDLIEKEPANG